MTEDPVATVRRAVEDGDTGTLRLALHPYLHWTEGGTTIRGRSKVMALLRERTTLAVPSSVEIRDGQVYRWSAP
jgi:limonene-1,2-epoxide hydrolase